MTPLRIELKRARPSRARPMQVDHITPVVCLGRLVRQDKGAVAIFFPHDTTLNVLEFVPRTLSLTRTVACIHAAIRGLERARGVPGPLRVVTNSRRVVKVMREQRYEWKRAGTWNTANKLWHRLAQLEAEHDGPVLFERAVRKKT